MRKISMSLPDEVVENLDFISDRLGITRSALAASILAGTLPELRKVMPRGRLKTQGEERRLRGESVQIIEDRVKNLVSMKSDLFSGF